MYFRHVATKDSNFGPPSISSLILAVLEFFISHATTDFHLDTITLIIFRTVDVYLFDRRTMEIMYLDNDKWRIQHYL